MLWGLVPCVCCCCCLHLQYLWLVAGEVGWCDAAEEQSPCPKCRCLLIYLFFNPRKTPVGTYGRKLNQVNIFVNLLASFCRGVRKESSLLFVSHVNPCWGAPDCSETLPNTRANTTRLAAFACLLTEGSASLLPKAIRLFFFLPRQTHVEIAGSLFHDWKVNQKSRGKTWLCVFKALDTTQGAVRAGSLLRGFTQTLGKGSCVFTRFGQDILRYPSTVFWVSVSKDLHLS